MNDRFSLLFFPKGNSISKDGKVSIYLRITVNGKRSELSIQRKIDPSKWNSIAGRMIGNNEEAYGINRYINAISAKIYKIQEKFLIEDKPFTSLMIKNTFLNKNSARKTLLKIFYEHNNQIEKLVGKNYSSGCFKRYERTCNHLKNYIQKEYHLNDIFVQDVDLKFINGFEYFLKTEITANQNTITKYLTNFKKIIRIAYANDWITKDPFFLWKAKWKTVEREFLSEWEVQKIIEKDVNISRLELVRDIFIFSCFTGLAYSDVKKLSSNDIVIGMDGERWIKTKRTKTDTRSNIPILPIADAIIDKYKSHPDIINSKCLIPVLSNQKMNAYLKEIADVCGITKNLTFHLARHTFATSITLSNGVPIESVSKMLGHKSLKTTQHYAKILDRKVSDDMKALRKRLKFNQQDIGNTSN
ncbi:site-specific recombinase XerD [Mariniflexile fucanivorans]|uniref:Site-specific recombinase XerD n=1 Tax=Mariniflexile fucanivorans TaxID=264023 RepID=A0A4R1R9S8_9FLAO|nr:site-specific integrase [Mariniflexile fucanivorans]TCL62132.1 site-specific recombinase XerD [Mariniflexile fucanivorans]